MRRFPAIWIDGPCAVLVTAAVLVAQVAAAADSPAGGYAETGQSVIDQSSLEAVLLAAEESAPSETAVAAPLVEQAIEPAPAPSTPADAVPLAAGDPAPIESYGPMGSYDPGVAYAAGPVFQNVPASWISGPNLKGGVAFGVGGGILDNQEPGYMISGGWRQPFGSSLGADRTFLELGGSYLSVQGNSATRNLTGYRVTRLAGTAIDDEFIEGAVATRLTELHRGSAHAAWGWYWGDPVDSIGNDPQIRIATRIGGRIGHARGRFDTFPLVSVSSSQTLFDINRKTDTFGGLFVGTEAILMDREYSWASFKWVADGEFAWDRIDFQGFDRGSFMTASLLFGFMMSR